MMKQGFFGALLLGAALWLSLPPSATAERRHAGGFHGPQRPQRQPHFRHPRHHRPRPWTGFRMGIFFGGHAGGGHVHRHYPHGHRHHVHDSHCQVVVEKHVYHHSSPSPAWDVHHYRHPKPGPMAILQIMVTPHHGKVFVDGHFLGRARTFRGGQVQIPVTPGRHTVQVHLDGTAYKRNIHVKAGSTAVIRARLM